MSEATYQGKLKQTLRELFPGIVILKNDSGSQQGIPDLLLLWHDRWAMLEVKESAEADEQPNQDYYIRLFNNMSFGSFIYPENEHEVLHALQLAFHSRRSTRILKS